jgi:anti-anti-sigma regulatory factor
VDRSEDQFHIRVLDLGEMTVIGLDGDLGPDQVPLLDLRVREALERDSTTIVLDCSLLRSLGRDEAMTLAQVHDAICKRHGRLVVRQPNRGTRIVLQDSGLLPVIEIED